MKYLKRIVINADDFGISKGTNKAIERAHTKGVLTSASIMPTGPAFKDAVNIAKRNPKLGIGVHLSLTWGSSAADKKQIPNLVDKEGYFYPSYIGLLFKLLTSRKIVDQIKIEFENQINAVLNSGLRPDHLNGQVHIHFLPFIFPVVLNLSRKYKIRHVRVPLEPLFSFGSISSLLKWFVLQVMGVFLIKNVKSARKTLFFGVLYTSSMTSDIFKHILRNDTKKPLEILTHPGDYDLSGTRFSYRKQAVDNFLLSKNRQLELRALLDIGLRDFIIKNNFKLSTFSEI